MAVEIDSRSVVRWSGRLITLSEWLWIRAALVSVACLVLVLAYDWAWEFVLWPLAFALVARLPVRGFKRVFAEAEKRINLWA